MSLKLISAQCSLYIAEKKYACTHMLRSACAHPPSRPYALTCLHETVDVREEDSSMNIINVSEAAGMHANKNPCLHACAPRTDMH